MSKSAKSIIAELVSNSRYADVDDLLRSAQKETSYEGDGSPYRTKVLLANELKRVGQLADSKSIYEDLLVDVPGDDDRLITLLNNYGTLLHDMGNYEEAVSQYTTSLRLSEASLGPEHPSVAAGRNNLAAARAKRNSLSN